VTPEQIDILVSNGASVEMVAELWKADIATVAEAAEGRRSKDRDRQRRHRESRGVTVTERDTALPTVTPSQKVSPENPLPKPIPSPPFKSPSSQKRGTRLAESFETPEDWIAWAMKKRGWSRDEAIDEAEIFARYWQAKPGKEATKLDWPKTWQNWVSNSRRKPQSTAPPERVGMPC
jgi:hypothetical protein